MAWGHMPDFMVANELEEGTLMSIEGRWIKGSVVDIVVARLAGEFKGRMAQKLWDYFSGMGDEVRLDR